MEVIGLLTRLRANEEELSQTEEKIVMIEREIAMIREEIVESCRSTEDFEVILGSSIGNGIGETVKDAKYVSIFSSNLFAHPNFTELVRGKRYGLFMPDSDFAPVVKFLGFDLLGYPDEYKKARKAARELAIKGESIIMFDTEIFLETTD
jgi:hypothetical protein